MTPRLPSYRLHKATGQAVVTLNGRDHYLGRHGSPESREAYDRAIGEWLARDRRAPAEPSTLTVADLAEAFDAHARRRYVKRGVPTSTYTSHVVSMRTAAVKLYGRTLANDFDIAKYKAVRATWTRRNLAVETVRHYSRMLREMFRWGAEELGLDPDVPLRLRVVGNPTVANPQGARVPPPIAPAEAEAVAAVLAQLERRPAVRAMIELQVLAGLRPQEARWLTPGALARDADAAARIAAEGRDRPAPSERLASHEEAGATWWYVVPAEADKTAARGGRVRVVPLGPRARAVLRPWLERAGGPDRAAFPTTGRVARACDAPPGGCSHYHYREAIDAACRRAGVAPIAPNRLRKLAATTIRREADLEAARVVLGHSDAGVTGRHYAMQNLAAAGAVAERLG